MVTSSLARLVEVSHWFSLLAVLSGLAITIAVLFRYFREDLFQLGVGGVTRVSQGPSPRMAVRRAPLPVAVSLGDTDKCDLMSLQLKLVQSPSWRVDQVRLRLFAGVSVAALHYTLRSPWQWFLDVFERGGNPFGGEGCKEAGEAIKKDLSEQSESPLITLKRVSEEPLDLGAAPRKSYPYVAVCIPNKEDLSAPENEGGVGAVISVIHVKDPECSVPTQILFTHLKHLEGGKSTTLTPIFVSGAEAYEESEAEEEESEQQRAAASSNVTTTKCIVCQDLPVTRVIFPCRHACTCRRCFDKLRNRCPMCRTFIQSYFLLDSEPESDAEEPSEAAAQSQNLSWRQRLGRMEHNFAMWMGLQEN